MSTSTKTEDTLAYRQYFREHEVPWYYNGAAHVLINAVLLLGLCFFCLYQITDLKALEFLGLPLALFIGPFGVYAIHRFPLHHRYPFFPYPYGVHTKKHHRFYTYDHIIYEGLDDFYILFFPPTVILVFVFVEAPILYWLMSRFLSTNTAWMFVLGSAIYFSLYEIVHFVSHLGDGAWPLKIPYFLRMRNHHRLHHDPHLMQTKNFGIVGSWCDRLFGTYTETRG